MSTATPTPRTETATLDVGSTPQVPFLRSVRVELRKMIDTRAGLWLILITGLLLLAAVAITLLVVLTSDFTIGASGWTDVMTVPLSLLLPLFAIFTVTTEWSQRTGLVSFTLEPNRVKVLTAKLVAVALLAVATMVLAFALGALANVVYGAIDGGGAIWNASVSDVVWTVVLQVAYYLMAFGIGMVLLSTPAAIAIYYVFSLLLPFMVYQPLYALFDWARDLLPWVDMTYATAPLVAGGTDMTGAAVDITGTTYAQVAVAVLIWVVLPMVVGGRRVVRAEIK